MRLTAQTMKIATSLGVGHSTATDYLKRIRLAGLTWPLPTDMTDAALEALLIHPSGGPNRLVEAQPHWPAIHRELRRPGVTLSRLWEEFRGAHPEGYGYSRFCDLYRRWAGRLTPVMRQHHMAGERVFVDYAGTMRIPRDDGHGFHVIVGTRFDLPPGRPSFITRVLGVDRHRFQVWQARLARCHQVAQASGARLSGPCCPAGNAA